METRDHRHLKRLAVAFLRREGGEAVATEVRCPINRYRVDVAGYLDPAPRRRSAPKERGRGEDRRTPSTVIIECKQSRADFFRGTRATDELLREREAVDRIRRAVERDRIMREEPELRRSSTALFPELDEWDFAASRLPCYRELLRRLRRIDRTLYGQTKFHRMARYRLADRLYIAAPRGMIRRGELPLGWGLLECDRDRLDSTPPDHDEPMKARVESPCHEAAPERRVRLLRNIAVAAASRHLPRSREV